MTRGRAKANSMARGVHWLEPCHPGHLFDLARPLGGGCMLVGVPLVSGLPRGRVGQPGMPMPGPGRAAVPTNGSSCPCRGPWAHPWLGCGAVKGARKLDCHCLIGHQFSHGPLEVGKEHTNSLSEDLAPCWDAQRTVRMAHATWTIHLIFNSKHVIKQCFNLI